MGYAVCEGEASNRPALARLLAGALRLTEPDRRITLHPMTADSVELLAAPRRGIEASWRDGYEFSKAGIMLDELVAADLRRRTLFEGDVDRRERLMTALDVVNDRFGKFSAVPAVKGFRRDWKARSDNKSPLWTTRLDEVPVVRAG